MKIEAFDFSTIDLLHERLCLDFTNSTPFHFNLSEDHLNTYADLVSWGHHVGIVDKDAAERLLKKAAQHPTEAAVVLKKAITFREAFYRVLSNIAGEQTPGDARLDIVNAMLSEAMAHMRIVPVGDGFGWGWIGVEDSLDWMLWPVAWSAADLLLSDDLMSVRKCSGHECDWLFLDTSRNHSRRWCDMKTCGNRAKARRHYERARSSE